MTIKEKQDVLGIPAWPSGGDSPMASITHVLVPHQWKYLSPQCAYGLKMGRGAVKHPLPNQVFLSCMTHTWPDLWLSSFSILLLCAKCMKHFGDLKPFSMHSLIWAKLIRASNLHLLLFIQEELAIPLDVLLYKNIFMFTCELLMNMGHDFHHRHIIELYATKDWFSFYTLNVDGESM